MPPSQEAFEPIGDGALDVPMPFVAEETSLAGPTWAIAEAAAKAARVAAIPGVGHIGAEAAR